MEIRFTPAAEDHRALARYWTGHRNREVGLERRWGIFGLVALAGAVLLILFLTVALSVVIWLALFLAAAGALLALLVVLVPAVSLRLALRKLDGKMAVAIAPDGLSYGKAEAPERTDWADIQHVGTTADHLFFLLGKNRGVAVPRRAFASDDDYRAALDALRRHLPADKIGAPDKN